MSVLTYRYDILTWCQNVQLLFFLLQFFKQNTKQKKNKKQTECGSVMSWCCTISHFSVCLCIHLSIHLYICPGHVFNGTLLSDLNNFGASVLSVCPSVIHLSVYQWDMYSLEHCCQILTVSVELRFFICLSVCPTVCLPMINVFFGIQLSHLNSSWA